MPFSIKSSTITWGIPLKEKGQEQLPLSLVNIKPELKKKELSPLSKLFEWGVLWKDGKGDFKDLDLPSMGLSFKMTRNKEGSIWNAECVEYPGYFIATNQRYRGLRAID